MPASLHQSVTKTQMQIEFLVVYFFKDLQFEKGCLFFFNTRSKNLEISHINKKIGKYAFGFWSLTDATKQACI